MSKVSDVDTARVHGLAESEAVSDENGVLQKVLDKRRHLNCQQELTGLLELTLVFVQLFEVVG